MRLAHNVTHQVCEASKVCNSGSSFESDLPGQLLAIVGGWVRVVVPVHTKANIKITCDNGEHHAKHAINESNHMVNTHVAKMINHCERTW